MQHLCETIMRESSPTSLVHIASVVGLEDPSAASSGRDECLREQAVITAGDEVKTANSSNLHEGIHSGLAVNLHQSVFEHSNSSFDADVNDVVGDETKAIPRTKARPAGRLLGSRSESSRE